MTTENYNAALTTFSVFVGVSLVAFLLQSFLFRQRSLERAAQRETVQCYWCHPLILWLSGISGVLVSALFATILVLVPRRDMWTFLIFGVLAVLFLLISWLSVRRLRSAYVVLGSDGIEFKYGRRVRQMSFADIAAVHRRSGYIVLMRAPRKIGMMIPPMFRNSGDLLRRLRTALAAEQVRSERVARG